MGYLLTQMFLYMLAALLLGLFLGWLIWGRLGAELNALRAERDRLKGDLDACGRARGDLERRLRDAEANAVNERARLTGELEAVAKAKAEAEARTAKPAPAPVALLSTPEKKVASAPKAAPAAKPAAKPEAAKPAAKPAAVKAAAPVKVVPDDLRLILGIGKTNEQKLKAAGVTTFAQIAGWSADDVKRIGDLINFGERIVKERWIDQAKLLAKGDMEAFYKAFPAARGDNNS